MRRYAGIAWLATTVALSASSQSYFVDAMHAADFITAAHGREILARELTAGEIATLSQETREAAVVRKMVESTEAQALQAPIVRLYLSCLGRLPDYEGFEHYTRVLASGRQWLDSIADEMAGSPEFAARYGSVDNRVFVELLYRNVLQRPPEPAAVRYWAARLDAGESRAWVLLRFSEDPENIYARARLVDEYIAGARLLQHDPARVDPNEDLEDYIADLLWSRRYVAQAPAGK